MMPCPALPQEKALSERRQSAELCLSDSLRKCPQLDKACMVGQLARHAASNLRSKFGSLQAPSIPGRQSAARADTKVAAIDHAIKRKCRLQGCCGHTGTGAGQADLAGTNTSYGLKRSTSKGRVGCFLGSYCT